jgi:DNA-binding transcriptional LysR family regulator
MDKLAAMRAFVEICEQGSLTAAAEALGKSQPTMARLLSNLETELGTRLLRRTTRRLALTEPGRGYLDQCRRIMADIEQAELALAAGDPEPHGELRITAPTAFGDRHVGPIALRFMRKHPRVRIDLLLLNRVVNLLEEGVDLAVRIGALPDSSLIARPVGQMRRVVVASPLLLQERGAPSHPRELERQPCVLLRGLSAAGTWRFGDSGEALAVSPRAVFTSNHTNSAVDACASAIGFGMFLAYQVEPLLQAGQLQTVLEDFEPAPQPVNLVYSDARMMSPSLRALMEFMRQELALRLEQPA